MPLASINDIEFRWTWEEADVSQDVRVTVEVCPHTGGFQIVEIDGLDRSNPWARKVMNQFLADDSFADRVRERTAEVRELV